VSTKKCGFKISWF